MIPRTHRRFVQKHGWTQILAAIEKLRIRKFPAAPVEQIQILGPGGLLSIHRHAGDSSRGHLAVVVVSEAHEFVVGFIPTPRFVLLTPVVRGTDQQIRPQTHLARIGRRSGVRRLRQAFAHIAVAEIDSTLGEFGGDGPRQHVVPSADRWQHRLAGERVAILARRGRAFTQNVARDLFARRLDAGRRITRRFHPYVEHLPTRLRGAQANPPVRAREREVLHHRRAQRGGILNSIRGGFGQGDTRHGRGKQCDGCLHTEQIPCAYQRYKPCS